MDAQKMVSILANEIERLGLEVRKINAAQDQLNLAKKNLEEFSKGSLAKVEAFPLVTSITEYKADEKRNPSFSTRVKKAKLASKKQRNEKKVALKARNITIRKELEAGRSIASVAADYNLSKQRIFQISNGV